MPAPSTFHAIILKAYETGNTSEVLHCVSAEHGRLSIYAKGLRRPRSRHRAVLQPLSLVEVTVSLREGADMATLHDASLMEDHAALTGDLERFSLGLLLAECASEACDPAQPAPELFAALLRALHDLDPRSGATAPAAACRGMAAILSASGYEPQVEDSLLAPWPEGKPKPRCFWIEVETATIHARGTQPPETPAWPVEVAPTAPQFPLPPRAVRFLYEAARGVAAPLPAAEALQLLEGLVRVAEYHHEGPLRSAQFWRELHGG